MIKFTVKRWKIASIFAIWFRIPVGQRLLTRKAGSKLDCRQLQWLRRKRRMATELIRP